MVEYVRVKCWRNRRVIIDGQPSGVTNRVLRVGEGRHRFELSPPVNYTPPQQTKSVKNTTEQFPMEIEFRHEDQI